MAGIAVGAAPERTFTVTGTICLALAGGQHHDLRVTVGRNIDGIRIEIDTLHGAPPTLNPAPSPRVGSSA